MKVSDPFINNNKLLTPSEAAIFSSEAKSSGKSVVLCHGVFDVLHLGHIRHLNIAKKEGDLLIVSITDDDFVNKGPDRPYFTAHIRAEMLSALEIVDKVVINHAPDAIPILKTVQPTIYAKGSEYENPADDVTGKIHLEQATVEEHHGRVIFTEDVVYSSSSLINKHFNDLYSEELNLYLSGLRERSSFDNIHEHIEKAQKIRALIIGDAILDEYIYVHSMGKASKENLIVTRYLDCELFAGGVFASANHISNLCHEVEILTGLGELRTDEKLIRHALNPNITLTPLHRPGAPTTRKTRYIDKSYLRKMFEVYDIEHTPLPHDLQQQFDSMVVERASQYDLVVVNDFGHGLIAQSTIDQLEKHTKFLAVSAQTNGANHGFNLVSKYRRADFVCIDAPEARLATGNQHGPIEEVLLQLAETMNCRHIIITHGEHGSLVFDRNRDEPEIHRIPAFTRSVVDTMGAGDAFLTISSALIASGTPLELAGLIGNAAGALKVGIVGHSKSIEKHQLLNFLKAIMK